VVRREDAVPSSLVWSVCAMLRDLRCLPRRVLLICVCLQRAQERRQEAIDRHLEVAKPTEDYRSMRMGCPDDGWCCRVPSMPAEVEVES
jgi:hypothetical protein